MMSYQLWTQGIPPADVVSAFQSGLDYCEQSITSSLVSMCFDDELNPVPSSTSTTPLTDTFIDGSCRRWPIFTYEGGCPGIGNSHLDNGVWLTSCSKDKPACNTNGRYHTSLRSSDVNQCNMEAGNLQQTVSTNCSAVSSSAEPHTVVTDLDDDVRWFFEDLADADGLFDRLSIGDALPVVSTVNKVTEIGLESATRTRRIMPQTCSRLPLTSEGCMTLTLNALDKLDESDSSFYLGQHVSESFVINNGQDFLYSSALDADNCPSEHCTQSVCSVLKTSDHHKLLPAQEPQDRNKESTFTPPQFDTTSSPEGLSLSVPSRTPSPSKIEKRSSVNKVSSKNSLHNPRMLCRSRHFRAIQSAMCGPTAATDDLSDRIKSDDVHNSDLQSSSSLLSQISPDLKNVQPLENKQRSHLGDILHHTTDRMVDGASEKSGDREQGYFSRLEQIAMCLSHGNDDLMRLAVEICHYQLALNPSQTWFVIIKLY